ncbi:MAG: glycosyltransferase family 1 protein [Pedobacter sp.]|nr:MAG: glycosyltransferase family 1 protein [Pedobacter sp.]
MNTKIKVVRSSTIAQSLDVLLKGQLGFLNEHFEVIAVSGYDHHLENVSKREKVKIKGLVMERKISLLKDLYSLFLLIRYFKSERPIIVHSITPKAGLLTMVAGKIAGVPIRLHTFTGLIFPTKKGFIQKVLIKMDKVLCWAATNIYPEGNGVKNDLISYKITKKPLKVLANGNVNGIDLKFFNPDNFAGADIDETKKGLNIDKDTFVFIFIGRLVADKGLNELVSAFKKLLDTHGDKISPKLILIGSHEPKLDPLSPQTLNEIESNNNIISLGFKEDIRPYLSISNAMVFPSYREGFPNVVIQAGAMGLPCIVTDINGSNELITNSINGTIIKVKDEGSILLAMSNMMNDKEYYKNRKISIRTLIAEKYTNEIVWSALIKEYRDLLNEKGVENV